jgi:hypothetical protein
LGGRDAAYSGNHKKHIPEWENKEILCVGRSNPCNLQVYHTYGTAQNLIYDLHRGTEKMNILYKIKSRKAK